jgi:hypothetical protein
VQRRKDWRECRKGGNGAADREAWRLRGAKFVFPDFRWSIVPCDKEEQIAGGQVGRVEVDARPGFQPIEGQTIEQILVIAFGHLAQPAAS